MLLYIDSNPQKQEQDSKTHENRGNQRNQQFLKDVACELCRRHFIAGVNPLKIFFIGLKKTEQYVIYTKPVHNMIQLGHVLSLHIILEKGFQTFNVD